LPDPLIPVLHSLSTVSPSERSAAATYRVVDEWDDGVGWLAHPDDPMERVSHAVRADDGVWLFDPVDAPGVDDLLADLGAVAGVAVLSSYHARDADAFATRHGVAVHAPWWMDRVAERVDAPIERYHAGPGDSGFEIRRFEPLTIWQEAVAYHPEDGTLVVPDLLGTSDGFAVGDRRVGVTLPCRLVPPRELAALDPERILFGHGPGVFDGAGAALDEALANARSGLPRALVTQLGTYLRIARAVD
jgi:hypothetical protein